MQLVTDRAPGPYVWKWVLHAAAMLRVLNVVVTGAKVLFNLVFIAYSESN